jgi:hypothetical protein
MSLIRVRRQRKQDWIDVRRGNPRRMWMALIVVGILIWYLGSRF